MKKIIEAARSWALKEIEKYGVPNKVHFDFSNEIGKRLSNELEADEDLVLLGTMLMDVKLGEAFKQGKLKEHVKMSVEAAWGFLEKFDLDDKTKKKIVNCVEAHHKEVPFICKEAEICANADCYRFLHPRGIISALNFYGKMDLPFEKILDRIEDKMDEKYDIVSLQICKDELEYHYRTFKKIIADARGGQT